jgi:hypothetical protein
MEKEYANEIVVFVRDVTCTWHAFFSCFFRDMEFLPVLFYISRANDHTRYLQLSTDPPLQSIFQHVLFPYRPAAAAAVLRCKSSARYFLLCLYTISHLPRDPFSVLSWHLLPVLWRRSCGIFDEKDHLLQWIAGKDHLQKKISKKTILLWRQDVPSDTWHLPPVMLAAGPALAAR